MNKSFAVVVLLVVVAVAAIEAGPSQAPAEHRVVQGKYDVHNYKF